MSAVREQPVGEYLKAIASTAAVPGGGSAAALACAMGAALLSMVAKISAKKAREDADRVLLNEVVPQLDRLADRLLDLSQADIEAYRGVIEARKGGASAAEMGRAYERAAEVPLMTAQSAAEALRLSQEVSRRAWDMTASDLAVGTELLQAGFGGALGNVEINLPELSGDAASRIEHQYQALRTAGAT